MKDKMQHNSNRIGTLFRVEFESLSEEEKNPYEAATSLIKGEEEDHQKQPKAMANTEQEIEKVTELQEGESSSRNEAENEEEVSDHIHGEKEEEPFMITPRKWWYGDEDRDKFFFGLQLRLSYLQRYLPIFEAMETDPRYAKFCKGPSSHETKVIMRQYLPMKMRDPGGFNLEVIFANKHTTKGQIDLGSSCSIMPFSIYKKIGALKLIPCNAHLRMADQSRTKAKGLLKDCLVRV